MARNAFSRQTHAPPQVFCLRIHTHHTPYEGTHGQQLDRSHLHTYGRINGFEKMSISDDFSRKKNKQNVIIITNLRFPGSMRTRDDDKTKIGEINLLLDTVAAMDCT